jgi:hypothetical protein
MNVEKIITLKPQEKVLRVARNYWLVYLPSWAFGFFLILAAFFTMYFLFSKGKWGVAIFTVLNIIGAYHVLRTAVRWHWNAFIVTDMRVVDVDQRGFFERVVSEAPIDKIQDLSYSVRGVVGTLFNFGSVSLQTSGSTATVDLSHTRDPKELYHLIVETRAKHQGVHAASKNDRVSALLEAAGELDAAEARALVTALKQAMATNSAADGETHDEAAPAAKKKPGASGERQDLDKDLEWFKDER